MEDGNILIFFQFRQTFLIKLWPSYVMSKCWVLSFISSWQKGTNNPGSCDCLEKAVAPHSSTLAWKIPWMEEPGWLQSMGSWRVGHDWATSLSLFSFMHWRRKLQPTPVFLPGESQGRRSLVGCRLWGRTASDTTEVTQQQQHMHMGKLIEMGNLSTCSLLYSIVSPQRMLKRK